ncbi:hypothetical protein ADUPG1_014333 [Aduncisulcus paluster]|uniref:Bacterial surface antigen (D15) domain-containing protein n=1 Tax=Aduncisulcus paluster TaxID=2918883 RepID=A0ABQ5KFH6_9EUKA|nr:hypothetical protein ADUPG1_014333 [Aduncisulcus paluster]
MGDNREETRPKKTLKPRLKGNLFGGMSTDGLIGSMDISLSQIHKGTGSISVVAKKVAGADTRLSAMSSFPLSPVRDTGLDFDTSLYHRSVNNDLHFSGSNEKSRLAGICGALTGRKGLISPLPNHPLPSSMMCDSSLPLTHSAQTMWRLGGMWETRENGKMVEIGSSSTDDSLPSPQSDELQKEIGNVRTDSKDTHFTTLHHSTKASLIAGLYLDRSKKDSCVHAFSRCVGGFNAGIGMELGICDYDKHSTAKLSTDSEIVAGADSFHYCLTGSRPSVAEDVSEGLSADKPIIKASGFDIQPFVKMNAYAQAQWKLRKDREYISQSELMNNFIPPVLTASVFGGLGGCVSEETDMSVPEGSDRKKIPFGWLEISSLPPFDQQLIGGRLMRGFASASTASHSSIISTFLSSAQSKPDAHYIRPCDAFVGVGSELSFHIGNIFKSSKHKKITKTIEHKGGKIKQGIRKLVDSCDHFQGRLFGHIFGGAAVTKSIGEDSSVHSSVGCGLKYYGAGIPIELNTQIGTEGCKRVQIGVGLHFK